MPDYQKGKIYKVYCLTGGSDDVYYGSTIQTLAQRMTKHRQGLTKKRKCNTSIIFNKFGVDNCIIELVENYPCNTVEELNAREGYYQRNNPCVNKAIAGRSRKEYREDNKEDLKVKKKEYNEANKEAVLERSKKYREANKEAILERMKEYYKDNKEAILEKSKAQSKKYYKANAEIIKQKINCKCGGNYTRTNKAHHRRTTKHNDYEKSIMTGV